VWATVTGTVTDAAGRPVAGAMVVPSAVGESTPPVPEIAVASDGRGRYAWRLMPGRYALVAHQGGRTSPSVVVSVVAAQRSTGIHTTGGSTNGATRFNSSVMGVINYVIGLP
jgi:Carboxypeptidase regulatory-like domain